MRDLSIIIPARREIFLQRTIEDILENIEADTEIIAVLDGEWADPPIKDHPRVIVLHYPESIGQRAATNRGVQLSSAKYVMKVDAHCSFDKGFDRKMMEGMEDNWTVVPSMRNLHVFDWVCSCCGHRRYQGADRICCSKEMTMEIVWEAKNNPWSRSYCFDSEPHFQYFKEFTKRKGWGGDWTETMSLQGSCFMCTREKYWELNLCDETLGSWGNQGIEVACKTWLSGGKVMVNNKTWYAHLFRTNHGFSFPWGNNESEVQKTKKRVWEQILNMKCNNQIYPVSWLVEKFWPVKGWTEEDLKKLNGV